VALTGFRVAAGTLSRGPIVSLARWCPESNLCVTGCFVDSHSYTDRMSQKILVVDSDAATRQGAMIALIPAGYEMSICEDSFTAVHIAKQEQPELIVLADSMANPESLTLIGRLFSVSETAAIPVVVIANTPEGQAAADRAGARAVLPGPTDREGFLSFVEQSLLIRGPLPQAPRSVLEDPDRLAAVNALRPRPEGDLDLDRFTQLAAKMLQVPVSVITLIDKDRQLYASQTGVAPPGTNLGETSLEMSFCQFAVTSRAPLRIDDASTHPLVSANPAVNTQNMKSYVGIPLMMGGDQPVGTLCAIDSAPRHWSDHEVAILNDLAEILTTQLDNVVAGQGRHTSG
jgi:CheY-like chemotaxis protein